MYITTCLNIACDLLPEHLACALFVHVIIWDNTDPNKGACGKYTKKNTCKPYLLFRFDNLYPKQASAAAKKGKHDLC